MASIRGNHGPEADDRRELAAGKAQQNADQVERSVQGGDSVPALLDSSSAAISNVSPLEWEEREASKGAVERGAE